MLVESPDGHLPAISFADLNCSTNATDSLCLTTLDALSLLLSGDHAGGVS
jgi:hypothetical protein